ncbi:uncharacterized protein LOC131240185 [Magnolia sinica]|uniref:uncharacterized protein LOC131240185 n=1 Tax=Magnolia sinica TaxID=86752 RepID=UPI002658A20A|nr:uncharacterized protein LOC131240185 [Magnolia sinica]
MAASANPSGNQEGNHGGSAFNGVGNTSNGNSASAAAENNTGGTQTLKHNPGISVEWTPEEQTILDEGLSKFSSESNIVRYAKIAMQLHDKTVRDVALRCRWMSKKESGKRRKDEHMARKNKEKKEKVLDPSAKPSTHMVARPNVPPYALPMPPMDNDDGISFKAIGGATGQLLEQNAQVFNQISANFTAYQIQENISLFCQTRDNILSILNELNDMPGVMKHMPPLPVKLNEELANTILPRPPMPMQS